MLRSYSTLYAFKTYIIDIRIRQLPFCSTSPAQLIRIQFTYHLLCKNAFCSNNVILVLDGL